MPHLSDFWRVGLLTWKHRSRLNSSSGFYNEANPGDRTKRVVVSPVFWKGQQLLRLCQRAKYFSVLGHKF